MPTSAWLNLINGERVRVCGYPLVPVSTDALIEAVLSAISAGEGGRIITLNVDYVSQGLKNSWLADQVRHAHIVVADGAPLLWAGKKKSAAFSSLERVTGVDLAAGLVKKIDPSFGAIIGGSSPLDALQKLIGQEAAARWYVNADRFEVTPEVTATIAAGIQGRRLVLVGLGVPKQEQLIAELAPLVPNAIFIGIGGSMDFHAGVTKRAPRWMQQSGLEWFHRLVHEPRRLWRRYLVEYLPGIRAIFRDVRTGP